MRTIHKLLQRCCLLLVFTAALLSNSQAQTHYFYKVGIKIVSIKNGSDEVTHFIPGGPKITAELFFNNENYTAFINGVYQFDKTDVWTISKNKELLSNPILTQFISPDDVHIKASFRFREQELSPIDETVSVDEAFDYANYIRDYSGAITVDPRIDNPYIENACLNNSKKEESGNERTVTVNGYTIKYYVIFRLYNPNYYTKEIPDNNFFYHGDAKLYCGQHTFKFQFTDEEIKYTYSEAGVGNHQIICFGGLTYDDINGAYTKPFGAKSLITPTVTNRVEEKIFDGQDAIDEYYNTALTWSTPCTNVNSCNLTLSYDAGKDASNNTTWGGEDDERQTIYVHRIRQTIQFSDNATLTFYSIIHFFKMYDTINSIETIVVNPCESDAEPKGTIKCTSVYGGIPATSVNPYKFILKGEIPLSCPPCSGEPEEVVGFRRVIYRTAEALVPPSESHPVTFSDLPCGKYTVQVTSIGYTLPDACVQNFDAGFICGKAGPPIEVDIEALLCVDERIELEASSTEVIESWEWNPPKENVDVEGDPNHENEDYENSILPTFAACDQEVIGIDASGCRGSAIVEIPNFHPPLFTPVKEDVLQISATKLKSAWLDDYVSYSFPNAAAYSAMMNKNVYESGQMGIFRTLSAFDYLDERKQEVDGSTPEPDLRTDGIIEQVTLFDWFHPRFEQEVPQWIRNGEVTAYNANGEELENKDILSNPSTALFGFKGVLPIAVAANARNREVAFENFEEYSNEEIFNQINNMAGNFDIVKKVDDITYERYTKFAVIAGSGRYAVTNIPHDLYEDEDLGRIKIIATAAKVTDENGEEILPAEENMLETSATIMEEFCTGELGITLQFPKGVPGFDNNHCHRFWTGDLYIVSTQEVTGLSPHDVEISDEVSHTGKQSLLINENEGMEMEQFVLELSPTKEYIISGWITTDKHDEAAPSWLTDYCMDENVGVKLIFQQENGDPSFVSSILIYPNGAVIDNWQKFEAKFTFPGDAKTLFIGFENTYPFYLDDIRLFPADGNLQSYVYDPSTLRQEAILDQNNYATIYKYDDEGKLFQVKKETVEGIKTIQITQSYIKTDE